VSSPVSTM
nr:Chain E, Ecotin Peptide [Homo sapiens]7WHU_F Chain F, Ecotin Peptide [Homo sapiens]7WHU_G Chain G, Ecotin Peptide [Homo sapiens]7WHU_H Chain H, Ecotin Peptide [Homo sapiens]